MLLPAGVAPEAGLLLIGRALRAFTDGFVAILLPAYLLALGLGKGEVGLISTATLLGSALMTLAVGQWGHRYPRRHLLLFAAWLMFFTGLLLAGFSSFWPLLLVAFVGTMNPSSGDVSVFLPLEHARLAETAQGDTRTSLFARYTFIGALGAAFGALATMIPDLLVQAGLANCPAPCDYIPRRSSPLFRTREVLESPPAAAHRPGGRQTDGRRHAKLRSPPCQSTGTSMPGPPWPSAANCVSRRCPWPSWPGVIT